MFRRFLRLLCRLGFHQRVMRPLRGYRLVLPSVVFHRCPRCTHPFPASEVRRIAVREAARWDELRAAQGRENAH